MSAPKTTAPAPATDTPEQRGAAYRILEPMTREQRDEIRGRLCGPEQGNPTIEIKLADDVADCVELDANAARTVLNGNRHERYLAVFPNHWGHGATIQEAITNARKNGARGKCYTVDEHDLATYGTHVDSLGYTGFFWALDADRSKRPVRVVTSGESKGRRTA